MFDFIEEQRLEGANGQPEQQQLENKETRLKKEHERLQAALARVQEELHLVQVCRRMGKRQFCSERTLPSDKPERANEPSKKLWK